MNLARALFGLSLLSPEKIDLEFFDEMAEEVLRRMSSKTEQIDLVNIMQAFANLRRISDEKFDELQSLIEATTLNERSLLSLFEVYLKLEENAMRPSLEKKIKDYFST